PGELPGELGVALELAGAMAGDKLRYAVEAHALAGLCELWRSNPGAALARLEEAGALASGLPPGDAAYVAEHLLWRGDALRALGDEARAQSAWLDGQRRLSAPEFERHPLREALAQRMERSTAGS